MYVKHDPLLSPEQEAIVTSCIGAGLVVHRELGPGFKEVIYNGPMPSSSILEASASKQKSQSRWSTVLGAFRASAAT